MIVNQHILLFIPIFLLPSLVTAQSPKYCNRSCGDKSVPFPFGFSADCQIPLNCSSNDQQLLAGFPILTINADRIKLSIEATCDRPLQALRRLYGPSYAPSSLNAILLQNCSLPPKPCMIPTTTVYTHFEAIGCSPNNRSISCYSENKTNGFVDYDKVTGTNCKSFLSSISAESFDESGVLEIQVIELGWWLQGRCPDYCSDNAFCDEIVPPFNGQPGFRCRCENGFIGDGYRASHGCRKKVLNIVSKRSSRPEELAIEVGCGSKRLAIYKKRVVTPNAIEGPHDCNTARYISGKCGGTAGLALLIGVLVCCCFRKRQSNSEDRHSAKRFLSEASDISIPIYTYKAIEKATDGFSEKQRLGTGAFGTVYAGKLHNNSWVAIKRIKHRDTDYIEQVMNEIKLISSVSHQNLVRLLGCSIENGEQILVYEFMPNGTLCQHLQRERGDGLPWPVRLTIAAETAQAIAHLHSAIDPPIYHRDIKSSNILLDYNFRSKVADFGLSRLGITEISHISTAPQGTPGYLDPQYHQNFHLSDKSDVYSFGVVLIEIITAKKVVDFSRPPNEVNLASVATDRIGKGRLDEIIDPFLEPHSDSWTLSSIHKVAELAFRCLSYQRDMRPTMMEVAVELEQIRLSRCVPAEEVTCVTSSEVSPCSSSSNISEQPLSMAVNNKEGPENTGLLRLNKEDRLWRLSRWGLIVCASGSDQNSCLSHTGTEREKSGGAGAESFHGKSGSISFHGLSHSHQLEEEGTLKSAPFQEGKGSFLWILGPIALISSLILPQFFFSYAIEAFFKDETLVEIVSSFSFEVLFYIGLGAFFLVTDYVRRPYLQFSPKRWGLITGLRGYLSSSLFTTGFKVVTPLVAAFVTWPVLGFQALAAVAPFLVGCVAQHAFETILDKCQSSCWPLVPIIFEVYRLYQLTRAIQFIQNFMSSMKDSLRTPEMIKRGGATVGMVATFQVLAVVCLWSLMTFLQRLFPSRPVAENY
ncbi:hypothetical protein V6N13_120331 [Hibiscus sabdariffa]